MLELIVGGGIAVFLIIFFFIKPQQNKYIASKLEKERQQNAKLESNLRQTKNRVEHRSNELEKERQQNAKLRRKLGVSESSLTEVRQHNEHLTSTLTQANQQKASLKSDLEQANQRVEDFSSKNKHLASELEKERQRNTNLESELKVSGYSGYSALLDEIYAANHLKTDIQKQSYLQKLRNSARELWGEYQGSDISPDYSRIDYQEAYLLCYFLPYSQPVPYLLNHLTVKKNFSYQLPENGLLTASFFGCGPGPEIFGLMRYLGSFQPSISISAAMLDREPWEHGRKIVRQLLDRVWIPDLYDIQEFNTDIVGSTSDFLPDDSEEWVKRSDLIVIQHCLNERHNAKSERLFENMKQLVEKMKTGAVMLIIERATYVQKFLSQFRHVLQKEFSNSVDFSDNVNGEKIKPLLEVIPKELVTNFLIGQRSNSVNSVEFIWIAISKK